MSIADARALALDLADRIQDMGQIDVKRFFGGAALVADGVQFAFVMKGSLYLRADDGSRAAFEALGAAPFTYAGNARRVTVPTYYEAPAEILEDEVQFPVWVRRAHAAALAERPAKRKLSPRRAAYEADPVPPRRSAGRGDRMR